MEATLAERGQVVIPKAIRDQLGMTPGMLLTFTVEDGKLVGAMPPERRAACEGIGLATPSQMGRDGVVRVAPLLGWVDVDLAGTLRRLAPVAVLTMVENDANALAIGATYGRRSGLASVTLVLNLESGVGGGLLIIGIPAAEQTRRS